jgi:cardiolipin synthase
MALTFTSTAIGTASASQTVTLTNTGDVAMTLNSATISGTNASSFALTNNACTANLRLGSNISCSVTVVFTPSATGTQTAAITFSDNAPNAPQSITLSGSVASASPLPTLSPSTIAFPTTTIATTSNASIATLTAGSAALTGLSVSIGGTNPSSFSQTNTCGTSLAANTACTISIKFSPAAATSYAATLSVADSAGNSPQTIALSGSGSAVSTTTRTLLTFPETDNSVTPLYAFVDQATSTLDMTMYEMQDTVMTSHLIALCNKGVRVRVIFSSSVASSSSAAYTALNGAGANCSAVDSNTKFTNTHQKTITIDGALATAQTAIMSLNLQTQYYSTTRDFAVIENDAADIAAIEATFNLDYAAGGTSSASDYSYIPSTGTDLIWSPTTAKDAMTNIIANAKSTLIIENEELASSATYIVSALVTACQTNHVSVKFIIVYSSDYASGLQSLKNAGCNVRTYADTSNGFYVHAKAVVADYGLSTQNTYMGSINYSNASMTSNRELGMYLTDQSIVDQLETTMTADYNGGTAY